MIAIEYRDNVLRVEIDNPKGVQEELRRVLKGAPEEVLKYTLERAASLGCMCQVVQVSGDRELQEAQAFQELVKRWNEEYAKVLREADVYLAALRLNYHRRDCKTVYDRIWNLAQAGEIRQVRERLQRKLREETQLPEIVEMKRRIAQVKRGESCA